DLAGGGGDALDADQDVHRAGLYLRTRAFCGSKSGVGPTTATVAGYCSPKYSTASLVPAFACSGGRKLIRMVLPTDGPDPALVTYDPRPCRSTRRLPCGDRTGSRPIMKRLNPELEVLSSIVRVQSVT